MKKSANGILAAITICIAVGIFLIFGQTVLAASPASDFTFNASTGTITGYVGAGGVVEVPSTINSVAVKAIGQNAFHNNENITSVILPSGVQTLQDGAFFMCTKMLSIQIPSTVTSIAQHAFFGCAKLNNVVIPNGITVIEHELFSGCTSLSSIDIPNTVRQIKDSAFANCGSLATIALPESLEEITDEAFYNSGLETVYIPENVENIGFLAFWECNKLATIDVSKDNSNYSSYDGVLYDKEMISLVQCPDAKSGTLNIPEQTAGFLNGAFKSKNLTGYSVNENNIYFSSVDGVLFNKLQTQLISFPNARDGSYEVPSGIDAIGWNAFYNCKGLTSIYLPDSVVEIYQGAFAGCTKLESIRLPNGITEIPENMLSDCYNLRSINIPGSVKIIRENAFVRCILLNKVTLNVGVESIKYNAFGNCDNLKNITFPYTVNSIESDAFFGYNLDFVYFMGDAPENANGYMFGGTPDFKVYFSKTSQGFTTPTWMGYPCEMLEMLTSTIEITQNGLVKNNGSIKGNLSLKVSNSLKTPKPCNVIVDVYNDDNKIARLITQAITLEPGNSWLFYYGIDCPNITDANYKIRVFCWEETEQRPLSETVEADIN